MVYLHSLLPTSSEVFLGLSYLSSSERKNHRFHFDHFLHFDGVVLCIIIVKFSSCSNFINLYSSLGDNVNIFFHDSPSFSRQIVKEGYTSIHIYIIIPTWTKKISRHFVISSSLLRLL